MRHALTLARRGLGRTWPNPAVGCVIVAPDGRVVGRGVTAPGGRPHAEPQALAQAGAAARGATAYVTLEPCAHHGRTPPCAEALVAAGVARVVTALTDPDPRVAGGGHAILRAAGIEVTEGVLAMPAARVNAGFFSRVTRGRPLVTLKIAATLDGRIATASGESRWITGAEARRRVHAMRASHDAVMVGAGTALADDPMLDVRDMGAMPQPVRIVVDSRLRLPVDCRLGRSAGAQPVWLVHTAAAPAPARDAWRAAGAELFEVAATPEGRVDPLAALSALGARGLTRVFCEGGAALAAALSTADLIDEIVWFTAGALIGGDGRAGMGALGLGRLELAPRFRLESVEPVGPDIVHFWRRAT
ncbi:bifunctional diaminohydroxyphosphoribosylaminopyrimidine deaminase/5-amino-6-(5-phosphoribosylamino)uracil reductase RibD [Phaeovulum vinaykumarii]|nr:bifunctional diaminohydroxyphosphoribosylaminopyrimidine deaminase/5-amino-6-(5-phosphoribosylamino)uracil reductase RibD [Phaeovulum vinaykumarii]